MKSFILKHINNILLIGCFLLVLANVVIAIVFNNILYTGNMVDDGQGANRNFIISLNEDYNNSDDLIKAKMLSYQGIDENEKQDIIKKLIKEYIVDRYTVILHRDLSARKFLPIGDTKEKEKILIAPKVSKVVFMGSIYNNGYQTMPATKDFMTNDLAEYQQLFNEKTTRSVKIISDPVKVDEKVNEWVTRVKFVYKTPNTDSIQDAKTEVYDISMVIGHYENFVNDVMVVRYYYPSSIFLFTVIYLEKKLIK